MWISDRVAYLHPWSLLWHGVRISIHQQFQRNIRYIFVFLLSFRMRRYFLFWGVLWLPWRTAFVCFYLFYFLCIRGIWWGIWVVFSRIRMIWFLDGIGYILRYFFSEVFLCERRWSMIRESWYWVDFEMRNTIIPCKDPLCDGVCASRTGYEVTTKGFFWWILFLTKTLIYISFDRFSSFSIFHEDIASSLCSCIVLGCRSFCGTRCSGTLWTDLTGDSSSEERWRDEERRDDEEDEWSHRVKGVRENEKWIGIKNKNSHESWEFNFYGEILNQVQDDQKKPTISSGEDCMCSYQVMWPCL